MSIGLCCQYIEFLEKKSGKLETFNLLKEQHLQYNQFLKNKYSTSKIQECWINNASNLLLALDKINSIGIKSFRFSSNLFPLFDLNANLLTTSKEVTSILQKIGSFAKLNNIRLTTHPDQFVVLSSNNPQVILNSIKILEHHAWIMDSMGLEHSAYNAINVHGGTKNNSSILIESINTLPENVRSRLTLENDERSYNVKDLYSAFEKTNIPIVFDSHHHSFNDANLSNEQGFLIAEKTWKNLKPLTHLSNTDPTVENGSFTEKRKHSDYVHYIPEWQRLANNSNSIDIDFEFKMKNVAIFKAIEDFDISL